MVRDRASATERAAAAIAVITRFSDTGTLVRSVLGEQADPQLLEQPADRRPVVGQRTGRGEVTGSAYASSQRPITSAPRASRAGLASRAREPLLGGADR